MTEDPFLLCDAEGIDCLIDATGAVDYGARVTLRAIERGKHLVSMNAELDGTVGPLLRRRADALDAPLLFGYDRYWAECYGTAPFLPMSRAEMDQLGWDSCDIIIVTGDAYVDHPSFGMAIIGRLLDGDNRF